MGDCPPGTKPEDEAPGELLDGIGGGGAWPIGGIFIAINFICSDRDLIDCSMSRIRDWETIQG